MIVGLRCAVCGTTVDIATPFAWKCPRATTHDPHHVLHLLEAGVAPEPLASDNPFVRFGPRLAWWQFARANGMTAAACEALTYEVAGSFAVTPLMLSPQMSDLVGGPVWAKVETGNVGGSHKARHLVSILLHLRAAELLGLLPVRPPLAIASCGNAAIAAATLAASAGWPIDVFVPTWMDDAVGETLVRLGARLTACERRAADPPGDPTLLRFREAVSAGAIPFSVQGPENGYCLDGGRTIGWELAEQLHAVGVAPAAVYAQVGGGAFAACLSQGLEHRVPLVAVQAEGAAPLQAALQRANATDHPEREWADIMRPWPNPHSSADGILDDETYDWIAVRDAIDASRGRSLVVPESAIERAHGSAVAAGFDVSATGAAGLAGALTEAALGIAASPLVVVMSGVAR
jgi:threonine synthase